MQANFQQALALAAEHNEAPFPETEFAARLERVRAAMARQQLDLLWLTSPESIYYLSGFQGEWYQAQSGRPFPPTSGIAVHVDHDSPIHFETPSEAILTAIGTVSKDVRIFPLAHRRDGFGFVEAELAAAGWLSGRAGIEKYNYRPNPVLSARVEQAFVDRGMTVVDATDLVRDVRRIKSPLEMEALAEAARIADIGMQAAREAIAPGVTELEVFGAFVAAMSRAGGEFPAILPPVMSGFRSNCLHPLSSRKEIRRGERVNVDLCGVYKRYHCNIARGFWVGDPPDDVAALHAKSVSVFDLIETLIHPGLNVREFMTRITEHYRELGILDEAYWSGGYELGIAFPPDWVGSFIYDLSLTGQDETFEPMTVVNHECNFFAPDGLGLSATIDTLFFGAEKAWLPCRFPRELTVLDP